jgi:ABC-type multidrug transport system ATPase subunit
MQGLSSDAARRSTGEMLAAVNLSDRARSSIRSLSHGMRMRVRLAQCFIGSPEVVLLDEPLNGLDPAEQSRMRNFILARRGRQTIVVSSHNLNDVEILCTHVAFVENGRVVRMATVRDITSAAGRVVYTLAAAPADPSALVEALSSALPGTAFSWKGEAELACDFAVSGADVAAVNAALLPVLIGKAGVVSVAAGQSLEQAYLKHDSV